VGAGQPGTIMIVVTIGTKEGAAKKGTTQTLLTRPGA